MSDTAYADITGYQTADEGSSGAAEADGARQTKRIPGTKQDGRTEAGGIKK